MKVQKSINSHLSHELTARRPTGFVVFTLCLLLIGGSPTLAVAQEDTGLIEDVGFRIASVLLTIPYTSAKITYAGVGGFVGATVWILTIGNTDTANVAWEPCFSGDYLVTPEHLKGKKMLRFFGFTLDPYEKDTHDEEL